MTILVLLLDTKYNALVCFHYVVNVYLLKVYIGVTMLFIFLFIRVSSHETKGQMLNLWTSSLKTKIFQMGNMMFLRLVLLRASLKLRP